MSYSNNQVRKLRPRDIAQMTEDQIVSIITNDEQVGLLTDEQVAAIDKRLKEMQSEWEIKTINVIILPFDPRNN